jgi:hypothetical protein
MDLRLFPKSRLREALIRAKQGAAVTGPKGCHIVDLKPTKQGGYAQVFVKGTPKKPLAHMLAYFLEVDSEFDPSDGLEVSHLCHNALCIKAEHLIREEKKTNQRRKGCPGSFPCPHCDLIVEACKCDSIHKCL